MFERKSQLHQDPMRGRADAAPLPGRTTLVENAYGNPTSDPMDPIAIEHSRLDRELAGLQPDQQTYYQSLLDGDPRSQSTSELDVLEARQAAIDTARTSRPLSPEDQQALQAALDKLASLKANPIDDGTNPNLVQIAITFDGTWNDRDEMACDTNAAMVLDVFEGTKDYQRGVGTGAGPVDAVTGGITGAGLGQRIDAAYDNLVQQIDQVKRGNPAAEVVLIVSGFSRGATAARAFTNKLNQRGIPDLSSDSGGKHETPRIGVMILFDTVASIGLPGNNINQGVDLSIPANAENVLHLTARDEHRRLFPLSSAIDPARPDDPRITEVALPGAHGDVGGGYANPYSQISGQIAHQYMEDRGVHVKPLDPSSAVTPDDPRLRLHDTGGNVRETYPSTNPR